MCREKESSGATSERSRRQQELEELEELLRSVRRTQQTGAHGRSEVLINGAAESEVTDGYRRGRRTAKDRKLEREVKTGSCSRRSEDKYKVTERRTRAAAAEFLFQKSESVHSTERETSAAARALMKRSREDEGGN